ncbi:MAG: NAD(P)H-dependent flavin oxidoreductase [Paracoccaceae bacterium]
MWRDRRLLDLLGTEHPIIQAPMAGSSTPAMAAAAANSGCLGSLGCAMMSSAAYAASYGEARAGTNRRLNMNFFCHKEPSPDPGKAATAQERLRPFYDELDVGDVPDIKPTNFPYGDEIHAAVRASRPGVVSFHFGLPDDRFVRDLKEIGTVILSSATTPSEARDLEARGVDAVIAQGWEAGGHHGYYLTDQSAQTGTMALVPQVVDTVQVPVIAAGGIADGRGIAAALALGAAGVQIGTAFLSTAEAGIPAPHRRALAASDGTDTRPTQVFSGRPARGIVNRYMEALADHEDKLPDFPLMNTLTGPLRKAGAAADSPDFLSLWAGQAVGLNREGTVADLVETLVTETRAAFDRIA